MTIAELIDRKVMLECAIARAAEGEIAKFERETGTKVERVTITPISQTVSTATAEVRL